jgi:hypothetical protein
MILPKSMSEKPPEFIRKAFPSTWYHPKLKLLTWHPRGVLNDAFADQIVEFMEMEERIQEAPFDRYIDLSGLTHIKLKIAHIFKIARRRRQVKQPVKSAFFADTLISFAVAQMYERLMENSMIEVRAFSQQDRAAKWLDVSQKTLQPPS